MNLLMISGDRSLASGKRGAFWYTLEELKKHWERIDIVCPYPACHAEPVEASRGVTFRQAQCDTLFPNVFLHPSPYALWYQPLWILRKGKELYTQRHHTVITVHDYPPFYNGLGAWLLHRATDIPWVAEIHHVVGYPAAAGVMEWIGRRLYLLYFWTIGRSAAAFRVVNAGTGEFLARHGVRRERIHLVSSFYLDHELLRPDPSIPKEYDVVFCGRLVAHKGVEEFLRATMQCRVFRSSAHDNRTLRVLVIGDGPMRSKMEAPHLESRPRREGKSAITFTGWLPTSRDVYRAIQSAKVFVMCSKSEGGPRVALEAMALGLPVIATRVGVMPDVIQDGASGIFTTGDPGDIAKKMQWLLSDDQLRARMGAEAKKILDRFEKRRLMSRYADFLQSFA